MSDEAIRELFCAFVEEGKLDEEIAEQKFCLAKKQNQRIGKNKQT